MMNRVYRLMIFFSVNMNRDVGPEPEEPASAEAGRFDPIALWAAARGVGCSVGECPLSVRLVRAGEP